MILVIDTETTGLTDADQIIELGLQVGLGGTAGAWRFKPTIPIPTAATAVHGLTDLDVAHCRPFAACIEDLLAILAETSVIVGYNLAFDVRMLSAEFARAGRLLDLSDKIMIDPLNLWRRREPRDLAHAHTRFVGEPIVRAHSAASDCTSAARVLECMLREYGLPFESVADWSAVADECDPERKTWVGPTNHLQWRDGRVVLSFGKHAGAPLETMDRGYLRWMNARADFPPHVRAAAEAVLAGNGAQWIAAQRKTP